MLARRIVGQPLDEMPDDRVAIPERHVRRAILGREEARLGDAPKVGAI
jgi:hypothetical protein